VEPAVGFQLPLDRVPQRIVRRRGVELLERVDMLARIAAVRVERAARPLGQAVERVVARHEGARIERELAPGDQLVQERLRTGGHIPPAFARAACPGAELPRRPFLARHHPLEHVVHRQVAEVQPRRQPARRILLGLIVRVGIPRETAVDERVQPRASRRRSSLDRHRRDGVIDRQRRKRLAAQDINRRRWPPREDVRRHGRRFRLWQALERPPLRPVAQLLA
jgi:hypothetical protein